MPSPQHRPRSSAPSLHRGDSNIPSPLPRQTFSNYVATPLPNVSQASYHCSVTSVNNSRPPDMTWPRKSTPPELHTRTGSDGHGIPKSQQRLNQGDIRMSLGPSIKPGSMTSVPSKTSLNQHRSGGIRATIRRLFGSKRERSHSATRAHDDYKNGPSNLSSIDEKFKVRGATRAQSQPVSFATRASALGSHGPLMPTEQYWKQSTGEKTEPPDRCQQRRNTLPSIVLSEQEAQIYQKIISPGDAGSTVPSSVAPGVQEMPRSIKRRSRSAGPSKEPMEIQRPPTPRRRRSGEIAYLRGSVADDPIPSYDPSSRPQPPAIRVRQPFQTDDGPRSATETSNRPMIPVQAFDFGLLKKSNESLSIEQRVSTLEVKLIDFEYAVAKLQGHDISRPVPASRTPKRRSVHELFPSTDAPSTTTSRSSHEISYMSSSSASPATSAGNQDFYDPHRSSKATTIRPATVVPRSSHRSAAPSPSLTDRRADHYESLLTLFREEQAARSQLEVRVDQLQKEVTDLRGPIYVRVGPVPGSSPASKPDSPTKSRTLHRTTAFPRLTKTSAKSSPETSRFSVSEYEDDETDDGFQDVYETPQENSFTMSSPHISPPIAAV